MNLDQIYKSSSGMLKCNRCDSGGLLTELPGRRIANVHVYKDEVIVELSNDYWLQMKAKGMEWIETTVHAPPPIFPQRREIVTPL